MADKRDDQTDPASNPERNDAPNKPLPGKQGGPDNNMRFSRSMLGWVLIVLIFILVFVIFRDNSNTPKEISASEFKQKIINSGFTLVEVKEDGTVEGTKTDAAAKFSPGEGPKVYAKFPPGSVTQQGFDLLNDLCIAKGIELKYKQSNGQFLYFIFNMLPWLVIIIVVWFVFLRQMRSAGGGIGMLGNFGRSKHRLLSKEHTNITFNDVAGI